MKRHDIKPSEVDRMGGKLPDGFTLCIYEAELGDLWLGFMAAEAGWNGFGSLPGLPVPSYGQALAGWIADHRKDSTGR